MGPKTFESITEYEWSLSIIDFKRNKIIKTHDNIMINDNASSNGACVLTF